MAYIKVDTNKIKSAYKAVDDYTSYMKEKMSNMNNEVVTLASSWQGVDFNQFENQWDRVGNSNSTYYAMLKSLKSYSEYLKYAEKSYKNAQSKAKRSANLLPK